MSSNEEVRVVKIHLEPHENADTLSIVRIHGWQVVVKTSMWEEGQLGAYIVPDSIVDTTRPEFDFLAKAGHKRYGENRHRVTVIRLRGVVSHGLLVPAPEGAAEGDDVAQILGVTRYEPDCGAGGDDTRPPRGYHPTFHVESWRRYGSEVFVPGERVIVTEKVNGECCRIYVDEAGVPHVGSRTSWKLRAENHWWQAFTSEVESLCKVTGWTLYGELHGRIGKMAYGVTKGALRFVCFDAWDCRSQSWISYDTLRAATEGPGAVQFVPVLYDGPYDADTILALADGQTLLGGATHVREGVVVRATDERVHEKAGRPVLKIVSDAYLERE